MLDTNDHPDDELLEKYSLGAVTTEKEAVCEEHLLICSDGRCRDSLLAWDEYHLSIRLALEAIDSPHSVRGRSEPPGERHYLAVGGRGQARAGPI